MKYTLRMLEVTVACEVCHTAYPTVIAHVNLDYPDLSVDKVVEQYLVEKGGWRKRYYASYGLELLTCPLCQYAHLPGLVGI